jgi:prepilin-type N-terminal cleavage/methylation domain-containing protein
MVMKNSKGFTLIELMIVLSLLILLMTIGFHHYQKMRDLAILAAAESDARNCITNAMAEYNTGFIKGTNFQTDANGAVVIPYTNVSPYTQVCNAWLNTWTNEVVCACNLKVLIGGKEYVECRLTSDPNNPVLATGVQCKKL